MAVLLHMHRSVGSEFFAHCRNTLSARLASPPITDVRTMTSGFARLCDGLSEELGRLLRFTCKIYSSLLPLIIEHQESAQGANLDTCCSRFPEIERYQGPLRQRRALRCEEWVQAKRLRTVCWGRVIVKDYFIRLQPMNEKQAAQVH